MTFFILSALLIFAYIGLGIKLMNWNVTPNGVPTSGVRVKVSYDKRGRKVKTLY